MLTDIFARRYEKRKLNEQIWPYYENEKQIDEKAKAAWTRVHDSLTMELGWKELSPRYYSYKGEWMGKPHTYSGWYDMNRVCETYLTRFF